MIRLRSSFVVAAGLLGALAAAEALAAPRIETAPPRLHELLRGARTVVVGRVAEVTEVDSGRVAVAELAVTRTLKGDDSPAGSVRVLELRTLASVPPVLTRGDHVVAFLGPAPRTSYLRGLLLAGEVLYVPGREHVLAASEAEPVQEAAAIVERLVAASREPEADPARRRGAARALAFDEIGARHAALVEDGIAALATVPELEPLADGERSRLAAALAREDLPVRVRLRLVKQVAALGLEDMIGPLASLRASDPAVVAASWEALRRLGAPPDESRIARELGNADPALRAAAARELLARGAGDAVERAARLALEDPDRGVRKEVIAALAATGSPEALPVLERAFSSADWELRQAAGRAIFQIGGRPAAEAFARLTFSGPLDQQRYAVALLRASGVPADDPLLERIKSEHPDGAVREVAAHGLELHEH